MNIMELSVIAGAGIAVAFAFGFLFGISYQETEDLKIMRQLRKETKTALEQMRKTSLDAISRAYSEAEQKNASAIKVAQIWDEFAGEDIEYGGF